MSLITSNRELAEACRRLATHPFITVDTEFLRETTFWPQLCVVQIASPDEAIAVDALSEGIDLSPVFALMANTADGQGLSCRAAGHRNHLESRPPDPGTAVRHPGRGHGLRVRRADRLRRTGPVRLQGHPRQILALYRLVAPPALGSASQLRHRRRDLSARHLPISAQEARIDRPAPLARRRNGGADLRGCL